VTQPTDYTGPALYRIRLARMRKPLPIERFLTTDKTGILAVGIAASMETRRKDFLTGLKNCSRNPEGSLLHLIEVHSIFNRKYRKCVYEYSFVKMRSRFDAHVAERKLVKAYFKKFGEVPPMNSALPGRNEASHW
jgi:hypothetical protein